MYYCPVDGVVVYAKIKAVPGATFENFGTN